MAFIFWLSSRAAPEYLRMVPIIYKLKLVHIVEYITMFFFLRYAFLKTTDYNLKEIFVLSLMIIVTFGLSDEFHQIFVQGRTAKFEDVLADGVGAIFGQGITLLLNKFC